MFGMGIQELILIFIVALIFLGPKKLPEIAKSLGRATREFKKASQDFKQAMGLEDEPKIVSSKLETVQESHHESCCTEVKPSTNSVSEKNNEMPLEAESSGAKNE